MTILGTDIEKVHENCGHSRINSLGARDGYTQPSYYKRFDHFN